MGKREERSDSSGDDSSDRERRAKKKSKKDKKDKRRETSAERAARKAQRRAEKKLLKEELQVQKESQVALQMAASLGYSNSDNPFGDSALNSKFVWVKKREAESKQGISAAERQRREQDRKAEKEAELEKLRRRRSEREIDMQLREQEEARLRRERDQAALGDWESREDSFHLNQAKVRAQIRIKEGRAKPIDILAMNVSIATDTEIAKEFDALGLEMDTDEPYLIFQNLTLPEVEELHKDIRLYLALEKDASNQAFWEAMIVVCDFELTRLKKEASGQKISDSSASMEKEVTNMLSGKTYAELQKTQAQVERRLSGEDGPVDVEFWELVLKSLIVWKAKAKLRDMHKYMLSKRLEHLRITKNFERSSKTDDEAKLRLCGSSSAPLKLSQVLQAGPNAASIAAAKAAQAMAELQAQVGGAAEGEDDEERLRKLAESADDDEVEVYDGSMSPTLMKAILREDRNLDVVDEDADFESLMAKRRQVLKSGNADVIPSEDLPTRDEALFLAEASQQMEEDEEIFPDDMIVASKTVYNWQDKYRPRKPRYFNRVHTGYEWNKYNQTHYDTDNPPPKVVQGYKFNIFYPDLIDKTKAPTYKIERDEGYPETVMIRFIASAPYEDIAFRIVNREWEHSHKNGFKSSFDRSVLQLHFNFKRAYYRR